MAVDYSIIGSLGIPFINFHRVGIFLSGAGAVSPCTSSTPVFIGRNRHFHDFTASVTGLRSNILSDIGLGRFLDKNKGFLCWQGGRNTDNFWTEKQRQDIAFFEENSETWAEIRSTD